MVNGIEKRYHYISSVIWTTLSWRYTGCCMYKTYSCFTCRLSKTAAKKGNKICPLQSELQRSAKRNIEWMEKWTKEKLITIVHVWRFSWVWASSSRIVGIKCAARRSRHRGCQGHRASSLWLWFLSQDTVCSDGGGLSCQGQDENENQRQNLFSLEHRGILWTSVSNEVRS